MFLYKICKISILLYGECMLDNLSTDGEKTEAAEMFFLQEDTENPLNLVNK